MLLFIQVLAWIVTIVSGVIAIYRYFRTPPTTRSYSPEAQASSRITWGFFGTCVVMLFVAFSFVFLPLANPNSTATTIGQGQNVKEQATNDVSSSTVLSTPIPMETPQTSAATNPYPPHKGALVLDDPLVDNTKGFSWEEGTRDLGVCTFIGGTYHSNIPRAGYFHSCLAMSSDYSDFAYEIQMTLMTGSAGGIVFRADRATTHLYYFTVDRNGSYFLKAYYDKDGDFNTVASGSGTSFTGSGVIGVVAQGNTISLYINRIQVQQVQDGEFTHGQVGGVVYEGEAAFSNAKVWTL